MHPEQIQTQQEVSQVASYNSGRSESHGREFIHGSSEGTVACFTESRIIAYD